MWDAGISKKTNWNWKIGRFNHLIFHLKSSISMRYDITNRQHLRCQDSEKAQSALKSCSRRYQKACTNLSFRCFSLHLAHM